MRSHQPFSVLLCLLLAVHGEAAPTISQDGVPLQLSWADVDGDGREDLVALMLRSQTEGQWDTYFEDGRLHGVYEDHTYKEKYLATWLRDGDGFREAAKRELGQETVLGFALSEGSPARLMMWTRAGLTIHDWTGTWQAGETLATPGIMAGEAVHMRDFPFWQTRAGRDWWLVPDLDGLYLIEPAAGADARFIPYPSHANTENRSTIIRHKLEIAMPRFHDVDGDKVPDLVFKSDEYASAWRLGETIPAWTGRTGEGVLRDINGDGMVDLVRVEHEDIERRKDLPKVKSDLSIYLAREPLVFPRDPDRQFKVPGLVVDTSEVDDDEFNMAIPDAFLDINSDGLPDLAGFAFKLSVFQMAKVVTTGRLNFKFLLHLSVQEADGTYRTLANGPFQVIWKINIRNLKMPDMAQMTGDFNGDGWIDIMMEKKNRIEITRVTNSGFGETEKRGIRIPSPLRDPDQVYGRDVDGDKRSEVVVLKMAGGKTHLAVMEFDK